MGVLGLLVPEDHGGLGLDETFLVPVLEECGRVALPHPIVETAMVAAPLLGATGSVVATCWDDRWAPHAMAADEVLVRAGDQLWVVPADQAGRSPRATVDGSRAAAELWWNPAEDPGGRLVADDPAAVGLAFDRGALGTAAVLVGLGQAMLDLTVGYVTERHQFGVPIGSFQAVKHHLADAALALELTRPTVWRAAWSVAHDEPTRRRDVSTAKAMASDAAELVGRHALQCHGAIGYTVEADLHLFLKRTWALARAWGDTAFHTDRVATSLEGEPQASPPSAQRRP
jgi:alkylation response protein AidB-like acyl-CoA dehydrogenase